MKVVLISETGGYCDCCVVIDDFVDVIEFAGCDNV
jgi:hypothetical protein